VVTLFIVSYGSGKVVTMSQSGDVIQQTNVSQPSYLSVSTDGVIYLISELYKCVSVNRRRFDVESHVQCY
jgi:hypothetical protein